MYDHVDETTSNAVITGDEVDDVGRKYATFPIIAPCGEPPHPLTLPCGATNDVCFNTTGGGGGEGGVGGDGGGGDGGGGGGGGPGGGGGGVGDGGQCGTTPLKQPDVVFGLEIGTHWLSYRR